MNKHDLSFEDYNYEKSRAMLPEEYEPIPSIDIYNTAQQSKNLDKHRNLIRVTNYEPPLYRFLTQKIYEDNFFNFGELLISNFARCCSAEVGDREDIHECMNKFVIKEGNLTSEMVAAIPTNNLLLCTSMSQLNYKKDGTLYEYGFKINNPAGFLDILTRALATKRIETVEILKGPCLYNNKKITFETQGVLAPLMAELDRGILNLNPILNAIAVNAGAHIMMNKPTSFAKENEYRFIWKLANKIERSNVSQDIVVNNDGSVIVRVPELVQFCERL